MMRSRLLLRLTALGLASAAIPRIRRWGRRRRSQSALDAILVMRDRALTMGIHLAEDDTTSTMRTKIAVKQLTR
jgi:hypothetical protein